MNQVLSGNAGALFFLLVFPRHFSHYWLIRADQLQVSILMYKALAKFPNWVSLWNAADLLGMSREFVFSPVAAFFFPNTPLCGWWVTSSSELHVRVTIASSGSRYIKAVFTRGVDDLLPTAREIRRKGKQIEPARDSGVEKDLGLSKYWGRKGEENKRTESACWWPLIHAGGSAIRQRMQR